MYFTFINITKNKEKKDCRPTSLRCTANFIYFTSILLRQTATTQQIYSQAIRNKKKTMKAKDRLVISKN